MKRLAEIENIVAVKEASGSLNQMAEVIDRVANPGCFTVLSGDDGMTLPLSALGGRGVVSVISNAIPGEMVEYVNYCLSDDFERARVIHYSLVLPLTAAAFIETKPIPIKYICGRMGLAAGGYRLPLCDMRPASRETVDAVLEELDLI